MSLGPPGSVAEAYDRGAAEWSSGVDLAYRRFAESMLASAPSSWVGSLVVDVGAGSGAVSTALRALGAIPIAVDAAPGMLRSARSAVAGLPVVAADGLALALATASVDGATLGFCVNHVAEPHVLLAEAGRVTRPRGVVLASTFAKGLDHPAKDIVDAVARDHGWKPSSWYETFRDHARHTDTPELFVTSAQRAGLVDPDVRITDVDTGLSSASALVAWRLGMPELAAFTSTLGASDQAHLRATAIDAVGAAPQPLIRRVLVLAATVRP